MTDPSGSEFKPVEIEEQVKNIRLSARDIRGMMLQISPILKRMYAQAGLDAYDGKVEFGRDAIGNILLSDVIDGDSCRVRSTILVE